MKNTMVTRNSFLGTNRGFFRVSMLAAVFLMGISYSGMAQGMNNKQEAEVKKNAVALERAELAHQRQEQKLAIADSLIATGNTMREESSMEIKSADRAMKERSKDYSSQKKTMSKGLKSKSKADVLQAKADLKELDASYKADLKAHDVLMKAEIKTSTTGSKNLEKGKTMKKESEKAIKDTARTLADANLLLDESLGIEPEDSDGKNKKKK